MLLKLTAQEASVSIYVQAENIVAFRQCDNQCDNNGTELVTNNSDVLIYVKETPEEITEIWGTVVKDKTNGN